MTKDKPKGKANLQSVGAASEVHADIRAQIKAHIASAEEESWALATLLHSAYEEAMYTGWGFASWKEYVEKELDFQQRKAEYLLAVGKWFSRMPQNAQEWARGLGFSKVRLITGIVTPENVAEWRRKLDGKTFREIDDMMKGARDGDGDAGAGDGGDGDGGTDPNKLKNVNLKFFPEQYENWSRAIEVAKGMAESDKVSHAADLICTDFLATNGGIETVQDYLKKVEKATGVRIVAYDPTEDAVVYGGKLIEELRNRKSA